MLVTNREVRVQLVIEAPTMGALEDFQNELRRKIKRVVNNQAMARRHGVTIKAPGKAGAPKDSDFWVLLDPVRR